MQLMSLGKITPKTDSFGGDRKCKGHRRPVYVAGIEECPCNLRWKWLCPFHAGRSEGQDYTSQHSRIHTNDEEIPPQGHEIIPEGNMRWKNQQDASDVHFHLNLPNFLASLNMDSEPLNPSVRVPIGSAL